MECKKLSAYACVHAVHNERLPLRVVVQVLFLEQIRATSSGGGSSRSTTTNTEDYWDDGTKTNGEKIAYSKVKRVLISEQIYFRSFGQTKRGKATTAALICPRTLLSHRKQNLTPSRSKGLIIIEMEENRCLVG